MARAISRNTPGPGGGFVAAGEGGNVYAGRDGNVYKKATTEAGRSRERQMGRRQPPNPK